MKPLGILLLVGTLGMSLVGGTGCGTVEPTTAVKATRTASLRVNGMTCASCAVTVKVAVKRLEGVASVKVDVPGSRASIHYDDERVSAQALAQAITDAGYESTVLSDEEM